MTQGLGQTFLGIEALAEPVPVAKSDILHFLLIPPPIALSLRLKGAYWFRGDSFPLRAGVFIQLRPRM